MAAGMIQEKEKQNDKSNTMPNFGLGVKKASNCCSYSYELVRINTFCFKINFFKT
jgi:hypothetical protein